MRARLRAASLALAISVTGACQAGTAATDAPDTARDDVRPVPAVPLNVVVLIVDDGSDIACDQVQRYLPRTSRLLRDQGTCFENATVTSPACCPSRAVLMTGQMGHNNDVRRQIDAELLRAEDTLQHDLTEAGYDTYGAGKFLNGVSPWPYEAGEVPSGFAESDFWATHRYYDYHLWDDAAGAPVVPEERVHSTTRTGRFLRSFVRRQAAAERPFYAYAAFKAPHTDNSATTEVQRMPLATPANRDRRVPPLRWSPEADLRDKLWMFREELAPRRYYERLHTARTRSMYDVDDEVGKTVALLEREGILDETAIFFTSDNGYHLGENGWESKGDPYRPAMDVPLMAWLPPAFGRGRTDTRPVGLIDLAATVYDLLDVEPGHVVDGRSLLTDVRRRGTFHELQNETSRVLRLESGYWPGRVPTWAMYRRGSRSYIEYYRPNGSLLRQEFYRDRDFQENLLWRGFRDRRPARAVLAEFRTRLRQGRTCSGVAEEGARNPCP